MDLINKIAKFILILELSIFILPLIVELVTGLNAVLFLAEIFLYYMMTFIVIWVFILILSIIHKIRLRKDSESIRFVVYLSLGGLFGPIIIAFLVASNLH